MPYPEFHACRLVQPSKFQDGSFRTVSRDHEGKKYNVIMGKLKGEDAMTEQAYRYPKDVWNADDARSHCTSHDGISFEPASESDDTKNPNIERRFVTTELRIKPDEENEGEYIEGYAAVFNSWTELWPGCREQIAPGAFSESIKSDDVRCLFNHDFNYPLGRTSAGNLELREDETGLYMRCKPTDTTFARDLKINIAAGVVSQQSFAFMVDDQRWEFKKENGQEIAERTILKVKPLYDVSPVTFPAYEDTTVALRTLQEYRIISNTESTNPEITNPVSANANGNENTDKSKLADAIFDQKIREAKARIKSKG
ncbi:MAG: HK97 family phage prohead protease [Candidatus Omnitrophica bacterium]|nr:HK97 family phage prohead protease [Candidatus Omnitrophota bacterium]